MRLKLVLAKYCSLLHNLVALPPTYIRYCNSLCFLCIYALLCCTLEWVQHRPVLQIFTLVHMHYRSLNRYPLRYFIGKWNVRSTNFKYDVDLTHDRNNRSIGGSLVEPCCFLRLAFDCAPQWWSLWIAGPKNW